MPTPRQISAATASQTDRSMTDEADEDRDQRDDLGAVGCRGRCVRISSASSAGPAGDADVELGERFGAPRRTAARIASTVSEIGGERGVVLAVDRR